jgi:hypothetical protein
MHDISEEILKLMTLSPGRDWQKLPANLSKNYEILNKKFTPKEILQQIRAVIFGTTERKALPIQVQARLSLLDNLVKERTDFGFASHQASFILDQAKKIDPEFAKNLDANIRIALYTSKTPEAATVKIFNDLGIPTYDLFKWSKSLPFLEDKLDSLFKAVMSQRNQVKGLVWSSEYNKLGPIGKDYVLTIWIDWLKGKERTIKSSLQLSKFTDDFLRWKNYSSYNEALMEVQQGRKVIDAYLEIQEAARALGESAKIKIQLPNGVRIVDGWTDKILKGKPGLLYTTPKGNLQWMYNPERYLLREPEAIADLWGQFISLKILKYKDIPYISEIGNVLYKTKTEVISEVEKIVTGTRKVSKITKAVQEANILTQPSKSLWDFLKTSFYESLARDFEDPKARLGLAKIREYLNTNFLTKKGIEQKIFSKKADYNAASADNLENKGITPWIIETIKKKIGGKEIMDEGIELYYRVASWLDILKSTD